MSNSIIRIKKLGSGSTSPVDPELTYLSNPTQWGTVTLVPGRIMAEAFSEEILRPERLAELGLPVFRWESGVSEDGISVLAPGEPAWRKLGVWWHGYVLGTEEELKNLLRQLDDTFAGRHIPTTPEDGFYDFAVCFPRIAGNVVLHSRNNPFNLVRLAAIRLPLHVVRHWYYWSFRRKWSIRARVVEVSLYKGENRLSVFIDRKTNQGTRWYKPYDPGFTADLINYTRPFSVDGDMEANGHPWPITETGATGVKSGIVPVARTNPETGELIAQPTIPLSYDGETLIYLTSMESFSSFWDMKLQGAYHAEPYAVWNNVNPMAADSAVGERYYPSRANLPKPDSVTGDYLLGKYKDDTGNVVAVKWAKVPLDIGAVTSEEESYLGATVDGYPVSIVGNHPIVKSELDVQGGLTAWSDGVPAHITDNLTENIRVLRSYRERAIPKIVVEVTIDTGVPGVRVDDTPTNLNIVLRVKRITDSTQDSASYVWQAESDNAPDLWYQGCDDLRRGVVYWTMYGLGSQLESYWDENDIAWYRPDQIVKHRYAILPSLNEYDVMEGVHTIYTHEVGVYDWTDAWWNDLPDLPEEATEFESFF